MVEKSVAMKVFDKMGNYLYKDFASVLQEAPSHLT